MNWLSGGSGNGDDASSPLKATMIDSIKDGWFTETETMWPGQKFSLAMEEFSSEKAILLHEQSDFQEILVFRSAQYGNVLCLDGVIQLTERDEFAYHEVLVHLPLCSHPNPRRILIVGGGDGGALREICRYDCVEEIVLVEIDPRVIEVAKKYFGSSTAVTFDDPRLKIVHEDAAAFLANHETDYFDIILGDTSDPVGPAESLFQPAFYESMYQALAHGGIVAVQAECFWIHLALISDLVACCADIFDSAEYATTMVPTYPCGQIGFILARKKESSNLHQDATPTCRRPVQRPPFLKELKWYSPAQHQAAFILPPFVQRQLEAMTQPLDNMQGIFDDNDEGDTYRCFLEGKRCSIM